jgi:hypothetical protein
VLVDLWHCDAAGIYSDVQDPAFDTRGRKFLRGHQLTDAGGAVSFVTIYPGWYTSRAVHFHFKIRTDPYAATGFDFTSQLYFDDLFTDGVFLQEPYASRGERTVRNADDLIFQSGGAHLVLDAQPDATGGYTATFRLGVEIPGGGTTTTTLPGGSCDTMAACTAALEVGSRRFELPVHEIGDRGRRPLRGRRPNPARQASPSQARRLHQPRHALAADLVPLSLQLGQHAGHAVLAVRRCMDRFDLRQQCRVVSFTLRQLSVLPLVVGGAGDLGNPAKLRHRIPTTLRLDEPVPAHRVSIAKKVAARFKMSRSSRSTRFSRRNRRSSSRSSVVSPSRSPASTATCSTQRRTAVSLRSISRQIVGSVRSPCRTKATTSALNEAVNDRRARRLAPLPSTFFRIRTPSSWAHAHI